LVSIKTSQHCNSSNSSN